MCGGKAPQDNSGELARQQEEQRQAKIRSGQTNIDRLFDGWTEKTPVGAVDLNSAAEGDYYLEDGTPYRYKPLQRPTPIQQYSKGTPREDTAMKEYEAELAALPKKLFSGVTETQHAGTFTPGYFEGLTKNYEDYYNPQLAEQFGDAKKELTFQVARSGNSESTAGNDLFSRLEKQRKDAATKITNDALASTGKAKSDVAAQRSNLYSLNNAAADPSQAASQAQQAALQLQQPQSYSPLGSVFAGLINAGSNAAAMQATQAPTYGSTGPAAPSGSGSSGSGKVVR
jgi:hypothetical protein